MRWGLPLTRPVVDQVAEVELGGTSGTAGYQIAQITSADDDGERRPEDDRSAFFTLPGCW